MSRGDVASLGFTFGVCEINGWHFIGWTPWLLWKALSLAMLPREQKKSRILADWLITHVFKKDRSKLM